MYDKVEEMEKEFKRIYAEETIMLTCIEEDKDEIEITCCSGYTYRVTYNDGNIEIECTKKLF